MHPMISPIKYTASVLHGAKNLKLEQREVGKPRAGELQVEIRATGLCGSDLHYYQSYRNGNIHIREPLILGHESAGIVSAIGLHVEGFSVGDHVTLEVGIPCSSCQRCKEGRYNLCKDMRFRSSGKSVPHFQGTLQQRINHPANFCHKFPRTISFLAGALVEPLSVAIHATRRAQIQSLSKPSVLILGAGTIGLLCAAVCTVSGAAKIKIADIQDERVQFATKYHYATEGMTIPMRKPTTSEGDLMAAKARAALACNCQSEILEGFDVTFECTGVESSTQTAIHATRPGGKVILVGMGNPNQTLPLSAAALREIDILGSFRYANTYPEAIDLLSTQSKALPDLSRLITHEFHGLGEVESAFQTAATTHDVAGRLVLKVMVLQGKSE